ncbi:MAG TPA: hypothetical protein VFD91_03985 [Mariniphaga sp.]|nr:hypothetical protein [Mariniphaga sp.]
MNFAGVSGANDQRNNIIKKGNTPAGNLWKLEDVDIKNQSHYYAAVTTGGYAAMLKINICATPTSSQVHSLLNMEMF